MLYTLILKRNRKSQRENIPTNGKNDDEVSIREIRKQIRERT